MFPPSFQLFFGPVALSVVRILTFFVVDSSCQQWTTLNGPFAWHFDSLFFDELKHKKPQLRVARIRKVSACRTTQVRPAGRGRSG